MTYFETFQEFPEPSRKKIERAAKHINDLNLLLSNLITPDFYTLRVEQDSEFMNWLILDFDPLKFPTDDAALIIGDVLHNLRSSLDILWHQVIDLCVGTPSKFTRFPIRNTEDELVTTLEAALKNQQITTDVRDFVLNTIKPYKTGNFPLWAVDDLNITDKHKLIIPVLKLMWIDDFRLEDDKGEVVDLNAYLIADEPWRVRLRETYRRNITVKDKGHATPTVYFDVGFPFEGEAVIPSLNRISEEVYRTVEAFNIFMSAQ